MSESRDRAAAARAHANDLFAEAHEAAEEADRLERQAADEEAGVADGGGEVADVEAAESEGDA